MKKIRLVIIVLVMMFGVTACMKQNESKITDKGESTQQIENDNKQKSESIKTSPDKYTWYIKDYVGKNLAAFGYTSMGGNRMDHYGAGYIELVLVNEKGTYIDISNEDELKKYMVVNQNIKPNTEMKFTFQKDENGEEYENLIESQTIEEIVLGVTEVGGKNKSQFPVVDINISPDKYTWYIRDYVGRNLASCGYLSLGGQYRDAYGAATIILVITSDDGSYIDVSNEEVLKKYKVISQNISPNTELKLEFSKDENGIEYSNLVENQNIVEIELSVSLVEE